MVSLGVDAYHADPVSNLALGSSTFPRIGAALASLGVPTVLVQEGGYHLPTLGAHVVDVLRAFADG